MTTPLHAADEYPPGLVLRATLALDFIAHSDEVGRGFRAKATACTD